jgi:hypothetical protein
MDIEHIKLSVELHGIIYLQFGLHFHACKDLKSYQICIFYLGVQAFRIGWNLCLNY